MIIIDEQAEEQLIRALRLFLQEPNENKALTFRLEPALLTDAVRKTIAQLMHQKYFAIETQLFFCEEGHLVILVPDLPVRLAHAIALDIAQAVGVAPIACAFHLVDLRGQAVSLIKQFEALQAKRQQRLLEAAQAAESKKAAEMQRFRRQTILDVSLVGDAAKKIDAQRKQRRIMEVLVIEDDSFSRRLVEKSLSNYHVTGLADAERALAMYARQAPDIVFLDINLPNVTGHELLEKIMEIDPQAYVIMLSGNADHENVTEAMKRGARGFVAKPFSPDKLHRYIERCPSFQG